jgi:superfamily II DNA or RNA helicase
VQGAWFGVPGCEGVAFIDPKSSQVDIIQAVGRAIRLSAGKEKGTIILPVFIQDNEDPDTAIDESNFKPIWDVLKALRAHDEILADKLDEYRTSMGRAVIRNQRKASDKIIFDLPMSLSSNFSEAINTRLVEATTASWEFWYGLLQLFISENGNSLVPARSIYHGEHLGRWISRQRANKDKLSKEKLEKLNALKFAWDADEEQWNANFDSLKTYHAENGNCLVPDKSKYMGVTLGSWVGTQRRSKDKLSKEKLDKLNALGFVWTPKLDADEEQYSYK